MRFKSYPIKKRDASRPVFIIETRGTLPRPKPPLVVIWKVHKPEVFVEFVYS